MEESNNQTNQNNVEVEKTKKQPEGLRYMDFVHVVAIHVLVCISRLYYFAKENSGPLKPGVHTIEGTVKAVVGPVYEKFHAVPFDILKLVDQKVGDAVEEVRSHVPSLVKEASTHAYNAAGVINTAASLAKSACSKAEPAAKSLYTRYEPVAEHYAVSAWTSLNKLPIFVQVTQIVVPTAAHWTEKYNRAVAYSAEKGYVFASYLPVVPTEKIAKMFGEKVDASHLE